LIETIFDTLNAKCAAMAAQEAAAGCGRDVPLMISMTITDMAGRNLSGHTVEAFWAAIRHVKPLTIGLNCSFGADLLRPHLAALSKQADTLVMAYPNAGLPNDLAEYDELPETTAQLIGQWLDDGLVNIVGGCCGTTPAHIAAIAKAVAHCAPRAIPKADIVTRLAGLEPFVMAA
jgi:5-methyltetrahydrofolate--homocysteine methyltransferase